MSRPVHLNRVLREAGLLAVRPGPFGEILDTFDSRAFAVCDHQLAHVYVLDPSDRDRVRDRSSRRAGVARVLAGEERGELGLDHPRSGELVALVETRCLVRLSLLARRPPGPRLRPHRRHPPQARLRPVRAVLRPGAPWPKGRAARGSLQKKLGFRTLFDVVPLDASLVRGSHGLRAAQDEDRPILIGDGPPPPDGPMPMPEVHGRLMDALTIAC